MGLEHNLIFSAGKMMQVSVVLEFYFHLCTFSLVINVIPSVNVINQLLLEILLSQNTLPLCPADLYGNCIHLVSDVKCNHLTSAALQFHYSYLKIRGTISMVAYPIFIFSPQKIDAPEVFKDVCSSLIKESHNVLKKCHLGPLQGHNYGIVEWVVHN